MVVHLQKKELAARFDPSDFRENAHKCILPQDHDALTEKIKFVFQKH